MWNKLTRKLIKESFQGFREPSFRRPFAPRRARKGNVCSFAAILLLIFAFGYPAEAQGPSSWDRPGSQEEGGVTGKEEIEKVWRAHREFLEKGDRERSQAELEKVYQWKLDRGIRNYYSYSLALVRQSQKLAQRENPTFAFELLGYAEKMAPDFSQVREARAGWLFSQIPNSWENTTNAVSAWVQGVFLSFSNLEEALPQVTNLCLWILIGFLFAFAGFAIYLFSIHFSFFAHHLRHLIPFNMPSIPLTILSILVLFSPFFLGLGWMWLFVGWTLVFWIYGARADRIVTVVLLLLLLLLPTGIRFYSSCLLSLTGQGIPEILQANTGTWDGELYLKTLAMNQENPQDRHVLQALGLIERRMGKYAEAEKRVLQWTQLEPQSPAAFNNLGNIYLVTNRIDQAVEAYSQAIRLEPFRSEAYYNLGQAFLLKLRMKEAEAEFQRAKSLQPQVISYHTSISSRNPNRLVIDRTIDPPQLWRRILTPNPERDKIAQAFWSILWRGVPFEYGEFTVAALFLLLAMAHLASRRLSPIWNCERCGKPICSYCTHSRIVGTQCMQCLNAFKANPSADPSVIQKKRAEVARYQARQISRFRKISRFLPGVGHFFCGKSKEGVLYLFILILFASRILLWIWPLPNPMVLNFHWSWPWWIITMILFLLFYLFVQFRIHRIRWQGGIYHSRQS
jgi:tetratricopeptide (TPR) repeat protein